MSQSNLLISGERRLATEMRSRSEGGTAYEEHYQHVVPTALGKVPKLLSAYLAASGGSVDMNVNGGTPATFDLAPDASAVYRVESLSLVLACAAAIDMTKLGDLAALTNGLLLSWMNDTAEVVDVLGGQPIKSLNDLAALFDVAVAELGASHTVRAQLVLPTPIRLDGGAIGRLRLTVRDDLSSLVRLRMLAVGEVEELV